MSKKHQIFIFLITLLLIGLYTLWPVLFSSIKDEQVPDANAVYLQQTALIEGLCEVDSKENVNRLHLQQPWFYDDSFQEIAGIFGNVALTLYTKGSEGQEKVEGAYCIEEGVLNVQFYGTKQKLKSFDIGSNGFSRQYRSRLKPKEKESISIVSLDEQQMVLYFQAQKREEHYFRKN